MPKSLSLPLVSVMCAACFGALASSFNSSLQRIEHTVLQPRNGDAASASDLYGIGVRIGLYLQSFGMLVSLVEETGKGYKLIISANGIGILVAWSILMDRGSFSFSESFLVLTEIGLFLIPGSLILLDPLTAAGEIVGSFGLVIALIWQNVGGMWLFTTHYAELPLLETSNSGWFFARVRLDGWFRVFMIVLYSNSCASFCFVLWKAILLNYSVLRCLDDEVKFENFMKEEFTDGTEEDWILTKKGLISIRVYPCILRLIVWIFSVASCEMLIRWNGLDPENSLTKPGQTIPLSIGVIIGADGAFSILKRLILRDWSSPKKQHRTTDSGSGNSIEMEPQSPSQVESQSPQVEAESPSQVEAQSPFQSRRDSKAAGQ